MNSKNINNNKVKTIENKDLQIPKEIIESRNKREKQSIEKLKKLIPAHL